MALTRREALQLGLVLLCLPAQYLLTGRQVSEEQRSHAVASMLQEVQLFYNSWFTLHAWKQWSSELFKRLTQKSESPPIDHYKSPGPLGGQDDGESPAVEVMRFREQEGYFSGSPEPRTLRPPHMLFRVGQVVQHSNWGYRGVIIGWDLHAKAPPSWISQMYGSNKLLRKQPHYALLVDVRDRPDPQITYVAQDKLRLLKNAKIQHPSVWEHFASFDGAQYIPRPYLQALYPRD